MPEYNPCNSCWVNLGNCNGLGGLAICCGYWCFKGPVMEHHDPNCCYCFQLSGFGCNFFCLGCVCCHPPWFTGYIHKYFNQGHQNQVQYHQHPPPTPTYFPQNSNQNPAYFPQNPNPQFQNNQPHHPHHSLHQAPPPVQQPNVYQDIQFTETPSPIIRDPQTNNAF